ncbi:MAG: hypothetical protein FJ128_05825 [Deltaproteobacteria bacterium]|nr:hypothetical protein [Deltaproteobacteria bacterium]
MTNVLRSADALVDRLLADPDLLAKVKADPQKELPQVAREVIGGLPPIGPDPLLYRIVVGSLGATVLSVVLGTIVLAAYKIGPIPDLLTAIGSAAVGALAGLLAPSPRQ